MTETDPPKTLTEAAEKFKKFLSAQHWPTTIGWVTTDNVLVDRQGRFWVRERGNRAFEQASLQYSEGVERNLGVAISAVCATDVETFASVFARTDLACLPTRCRSSPSQSSSASAEPKEIS